MVIKTSNNVSTKNVSDGTKTFHNDAIKTV